MNFYLTDFDIIRSEASLKINKIDYSSLVKLNEDQIDWFINGNIASGKRRKPGTLELEDIPQPTKSQRILERRAKYQKEVNALMGPATMAVILYGELEPVRKAAIKSQYEALTAQLQIDIIAINNGE